jgi:hypothetical protein
MDELIDAVQRQAGISEEEARKAVAATMAFFSARLPSPFVGRIRALLEAADQNRQSANPGL